MKDGLNNKPDPLNNLLPLSPEEVLRGLPLDMRYRLEPLLGALAMLEEKPLSEKEHDEMLKIAQRNALAISDMLKLILRYFEAREGLKKTNNQPSE